MKSLSIAAAAVLILGVSGAIAQSPIREGRWEITMQMQMPNMPMQMPAQNMDACVTKKDLETPGGDLPKPADKGSNCTTSDRKVDGNKITWNMKCTGRDAMTGSGEIVVDGDTYTGAMKMNSEHGEMTMNYTGKRIGDCTQ